ncbi:MAG: hypothetical protein K2P58_13990 [Hyphomonadaceae bacterium]|nr:hypothetical protein [Hyphomonadaceae bacterium]
MNLRAPIVAGLLMLAACEQTSAPDPGEAAAPQLGAPTLETEPSRVFATANEAATGTTGQLTVSLVQHMGDASGGGAHEELTLVGANGVEVRAQIVGAMSPATQLGGQTLRALLGIPVEEPQVLVYRVTGETRRADRGLCGDIPTSHVVLWEPSGPNEPVMRVIGASGGAPGEQSARACPRLDYRRA